MIKNKQKLLIISLLICFVLSVSFVSASESADNTTISAADGQDSLQTIEVENLQQSTDQGVLGETDAGTFTALDARINSNSVNDGDTVYLENDYSYVVGTDSDELKNGVYFTKNIIIDGQGYTINGSNVARILDVGNNAANTHPGVTNVVLRNINFVNAYSGDSSGSTSFGAVEFIGNGKIENCNFSYNQAGSAAALLIGWATNFNVTNCNFKFNDALSNGGGAIRLRTGVNSIRITDSVFINNTAPTQAGAVHFSSGQGNQNISVINCDFINNSANSGGALLFQCPNGTVKDSRFNDNKALDTYGGAIYWDGSYGNVINSNFTNNNATLGGGAIYSTGASPSITLSKFEYNNASEGGAIYFSGTPNGIITNSTFNHNNATSNGGALYVSGTLFTLIDVNFTNDNASYGGALYLDVGAYINHCLFDHESATVDGGAIYLNTVSVTDPSLLAAYADKLGIFNSTLSNCNAGRDGGAGYVRVSYGVVKNTTFTNNFAGHDGGAGYVYGSHGNLISSRFIGNRAVNAGGAVMWIGSNGTANHTNFTSNHAVGGNGNGGSIVWQGVNGTINDCRFNISTAKKAGGAVYIAGNNTKIKCSDFQRYNATSGGAIYVAGSKVNITNDTFSYGEAQYGGAIYVNGNETRIIDVNLTRNHAIVDGGVIYVEGNDAKVIRTNITYSYCEHSGGAVYINGNGTLVKDTNFTYTNASSANGGAVYVNGDDANITNSKFSLNYAINGGAIYIEGSGTHVRDTDFSQNGVNPTKISSTGDTKGGSIYIAGDGTVIEKSNFTQSNAGNGGILYIAGNHTNITKSNFKYALAVSNGGAIYVGGRNASITSSTFQFTNATNGGAIYLAGNETNIEANFSYCFAKGGNGGAIYVSGNSNNVTNANFSVTNAIGGNGGAIYAGGVNTTLRNCHSNIANAIQTRPGTGNGGAVYISGNEAKIIKSVFNFYNATGAGGALYVEGNDLNISHSSFEYGESNLGGAIYINGDKTHMEHSNLTHNHANTNGGIIYINGHNATITDSNLKYSYALASGGAVFINGADNEIKKSNLTYNNASSGFGGSIYINGNYNNITECNFSAMTSYISGGAIYITGANTTISQSNFTRTAAYSGDGGAIYISGLNTTVKHSIFEDISIDDGDGGAIYIEGNRAEIDYCNFTRVYSPNNNGGAVCVAGNYSKILNSNMTNCSAFTNGGALYIIGHNATVNVNFENCEATGYIHYKSLDYYVPSYGGAIYIEGHDNNITSSSFKNCTVHYKTSEAISSGGAVYIKGQRNTIEYSTFTQDVSEDSIGADIYVKGNNNNITHSSFDNSKASSGGSIYVEGHKVYIHNSTFEICRTPGDGGAIYLSGNNGTIDNCTLKETYSNSNGGAIYISGHNDTVSNSHFKRNDQRGTVVVQYGGSIYIEGDLGNVINSTFNHTGAIADGGAIYVAGNNVTIDNSNFTNASANYGGVIYVAGDYAMLNKILCENSNSTKDGGALDIRGQYCELHNSTFKNNTALDDGGAINWMGDFGKIYNIACEDNKGISGGTSHSKGGTICLTANDMNVNKTKITNSFTSYNGGAMFVTGNNVNITSSDFKNCHVNVTLSPDGDDLPYGGALYILGNDTNVLDCTFDNCTAIQGGIIYVQGHNVIINNATSVKSSATEYGGAIYVYGVNATISKSNISDSNATLYGGAICIYGDLANVTGSNFTQTNATAGGAIYIEGDDSNVEHSIIKKSYASTAGGAIYVHGPLANMTNVTINSSYAHDNGGAIFIDDENATIKDCHFTNTNATLSGGAIYIEGIYAKVIGSAFNLTNAFGHTTDNGGGAIFINGGYAVVDTSNFTDAYANYNNRAIGGAIYITGHNVNVTGSNFNHTIANMYGGGIYVAGENTTIRTSSFNNCSVDSGHGGAIYVTGKNTNVIGSNFTFCNASNTAGALYLGGSNTTVLESNFINNTANYGGAMYVAGGGASVTDSNFTNNSAYYGGEAGGAIYWNGGSNSDSIVGCNFTNNRAPTAMALGGAVYWSQGNGNTKNGLIKDTYFYKNHAARHGGAIDWFTSDDSMIYNCTFIENNVSVGSGGAIYLSDDHGDCVNMTVIYCNFTNNHAKSGGAISNQIYGSHILNSTFVNNTADEYAGDIFTGNEKANSTEIVYCNFTGSNANVGGSISIVHVKFISILNCTFNKTFSKTGEGGAISIISNTNLNLHADSNVIDNCNFTYCIAATRGGGIYANGKYINMTNVEFKNCSANIHGGSIFVDTGIHCLLWNATFDGGNATNQGGAIAWWGNYGNITNISANNIFASSGGVLYVGSDRGNRIAHTSANLLNISNSHANNGGAIDWRDELGSLTNVRIINSSTIADKDNGGGAIYVQGGSNKNSVTELINITIAHSNSTTVGGSIKTDNYVKITNLTIDDTFSVKEGGAIYWNGVGGVLNIVNINNTYSKNMGGGAIYWNRGNGELYNANISNAHSKNNGGAISWLSNDGTIVNLTIDNSYSNSNGGAIAWWGNNGKLMNVSINNSNATGARGGAVCINMVSGSSYGFNNTFTNLTISNVKASYGGAIALISGNTNACSNNIFNNVSIKNASANNGGAVYITGYSRNNTFYKFNVTNASAVDGGAFYVTGSDTNSIDNKVINSTIANCTATNNGGAFYWKASGGIIVNSTIINNTAKYGGAIYADTYSLTINKSNFTLNKAERGSAIYTNVALSITNSSFIKNRANSASLDIEVNSANTQVTITFKGWDNLLNAIYVTSTTTPIAVDNVDYWDYLGLANTGTQSLTATTTSSMVEAGQNITIAIYDLDNNEKYYGNDILTDVNGQIVINVGTLGSSQRRQSSSKFGDILMAPNNAINVYAFLTNEDYYTYIEQTKGTKAASHINAAADNVNYHQNTTVYVSMVEDATGIVSIYIDDVFYDNITLDSEHKGSLINVTTLKWGNFLPAGEHELLAKYWGDDTYMPSRNTTTFEIYKLPTNITIDVDDKGYSLYINLTVFNDEILDVTGNVTLEIDGRTFTVNIADSKGFIVVDNVVPGNYTINAAYNGDSNYYNSTNSTDFTMIHKDPSSIVLDVHDMMINETESINVTVNVNGTGNVTIYVNGKPYNVTLNESKAQLNVTGLPKGTNYVLVIYDGDKNLTGGRVEDTFLVSKYEPTININTTNITYGKTEKLNITLPDDAEGIIKVTINGTKYYGEIDCGEVIINVTDLEVGVYNVTVYFFEDGKYLAGTNSTLFNVSRATPDVIIGVDNVTYGNHTIVYVTLPGDATGNVTIKINDTLYVKENLQLTNGTASWDFGVLASENYTVEVTYTGDKNYNGNANTTDFEVYPAAPAINPTPMTIDVHDIYVGDTITIVVSVPAGASGNITLEINGINKTERIDANGNATFTFSDLIYGNKTVYANYIGDANYVANHTTDQFKVLKRNSQVNVTAVGNSVGGNATVTVQVQSNATGYVTLDINGTNYTVKLNSTGGGSVNITGLGNGTYYVHATYLGDNQYSTAENNTKTFVMSKLAPNINIAVDNVTYGNRTVIVVTIPGATGNITIKINESDKGEFSLDNGVVEFDAGVLGVENYTVYVTYEGDNNYNSSNANKDFNVSQATPLITIDIAGVEIDKTTTVTFTINSNATGNLTGSIGGVEFNKKINDGQVVVTTEKLTNRTYAIVVNYAGDKNYTQNSATDSFDVHKKSDYKLNITAGDVKVDELTDITVNVPGDASGIVIVEIGGHNYTASISQGKAVFRNDTGLGEGKYNITAYFGDAKYANKTAAGVFYITKHDPEIIISPISPINVGDKAVITVTAPSDVLNNVSIEIDGIKLNKTVDSSTGVAVFEVQIMSNGTRTVVATYNGDRKYMFNSTTAQFDVTKRISQLNVTAVGNSVGGNATVTVQVQSNATGYVTLDINGTNYTVKLNSTGGGSVNITGLGNGTYYVHATYLGDNQYSTAENNTKTFVMSKLAPNINIAVDNVTYGNRTVIVVTIPGATGNITIKINESDKGEFSLDNGVVEFDAGVLGVENYTVYVTYEGDNNYNSSNANKDFNVSQATPLITIDIAGVEIDKTTTVTFTINSNATGNLTGSIGGVEFNKKINDGQVVVTTEKLTNRTYAIVVNYAGDKNYTQNSATDSFDVHKKSDYKLNITAGDVKVDELTDITVNVPGDASGIVIVEIGGHNYTASISQGKAVFRNDTGLGEGKYNITAYFGDAKYANKTAAGVFYITKHDPEIIISPISPINVGDKAVITVTAPSDVLNNVSIEIDGIKLNKTVDSSTGVAVFEVQIMSNGTRTVVATYNGDRKYMFNSTTAQFDVTKRISQLNVTAVGNSVGGNATVTVQVQSNATGYVALDINGTNYTVKLNSTGGGSINITGLGNGTYYVHATYLGDNQYSTAENNTKTFIMTKSNVEMSINVLSIDYGQKANITVSITEDATGYITVRIVNGTSDIRNITLPIVEGKVNWVVSDLAADNYTVYANYSGNGKYNLNNTDKVNRSFEVRQVTPVITIEVGDVEIDKTTTVTIYINSTATGHLTGTIGGVPFDEEISGGKVVVTTEILTNKTYEIAVSYVGDKNYTEASATGSFDVAKSSDYELNITVGDIKVGDLTNITVNVPEDAEGKVIININGTNYTAAIKEGKAVFRNDTGLGEGKYNITAYFGDAKYANRTATGVFYITKVETPISIDVNDCYVGDTVKVVVTVPAGVSENVTVEINGRKFTNATVNGNATFYIKDLAYGNKTITAIYVGDVKYVANSATANFTVDKRKSTVNITVNATVVGNDTIINVTIPANATGYVIISVDETNYTVNTTGGNGTLLIKDLKSGLHKVNVTYLGDEQYFSSKNNDTFNVNRISSDVSLKVENITVGDKAIINIAVPKDATGNVTTVIVNGETYYVAVVNGTGILVVPGLEVGNYTVQVTYNGDDKYLPSAQNETKFSVNKVNVTESDIKVIDQGNGTVVVVIPGNAAGNVTIEVENNTYNGTVINGTATINLTNETPGEHNITVIYLGDDTHTNTTVNATVTIPKYETPISVNISDIKEGGVAVINVTVPRNATGNVTVAVDGKQYPGVIVNGTAVVYVGNLTAGPKTVVVEYPGDDNYTANYTVGNFTVEKAKTTPDIVVVDQGNGTVVVVVGDNATGNVTIKVGDGEFNGTVVNGTAVIAVGNLTPGNNTVEVIYSGDDNHNNVTVNATVNGAKYDSPINVTVSGAKEGEITTITVEVPRNATGNVTVAVDGKQYPGVIVNGTAVVYVGNLTAGPKTVVVEYPGDDNYTANYTVGNFTVDKAKVVPDIKVVDLGNGTVVVVVGGNATGNVTITVGDENFTGNVTNGTAVITLTNVTAGTHEIEVIYSGDDTYNSTTKEATVTIINQEPAKKDTPISVDVKDIRVGDVAEITVNVPYNATGNITIEINGISKTANITAGKAEFTFENLTAGVKTIAVIYGGDENYTHNATTDQFNVFKRNSFVNATIEDSKVGENVTITVYVPSDANGQVLVDIGGVGYYVNVTNGIGTAQIPRIPSGIYPVSLTYLGDDKYVGNSNVSECNVSKVKSFVIPTAHNIYVGENEVILLEVPEDATGNVTLVIDGEEYVFNLDTGLLGASYSKGEKYSVAVSGGNGEIIITGLPKGEYVVSARYNGNYKYLPSTNKTTFTVSKQSTDIEVIDQGNGTVVVIVDSNATGNVTINVENKTFVVNLTNGTAAVNLENVTPGKHNITVIYSGDGDYSSKTVNSTVDIPKHATPLSVDCHDIYVGDTETVTVYLPDNATGKVEIEINGKKYLGEAENGKAVFKVTGLAFGEKTVAVTYYGDDNYVENFTTGQFTVYKRPSTVSASSKDIKYGKDETITITVPADQTGRVLVDVNGVGYYANIINGKAKVIVSDLPAGKYVAVVTYEGDGKYLPSTTTTSFKVTKSSTPISATDDKIPEGNVATVVVSVPGDATGTITISVDGKKYTANIVSGEAVFKVPGLTKGNYKVDVSYSGDNNYDGNATVSKIVVYKNESENIHYHGEISLAKYETGNPVLALLLILLAIGSAQLRRFKK